MIPLDAPTSEKYIEYAEYVHMGGNVPAATASAGDTRSGSTPKHVL